MRISEPLASGARIGDEIRANLLETGGQIGDQPQERPAHIIFVALLVRKKPLPLVVSFEIPEKAEQARPEITVRCHGLLRHLRSHLYVRSRYPCKAIAVSRRFFLPMRPMKGMKILN